MLKFISPRCLVTGVGVAPQTVVERIKILKNASAYLLLGQKRLPEQMPLLERRKGRFGWCIVRAIAR